MKKVSNQLTAMCANKLRKAKIVDHLDAICATLIDVNYVLRLILYEYIT